MPELDPPPGRFRISIGGLIGLVGLAALGCAWPGLIPTEVVAVLFWIRNRSGTEQERGRLVSLGVVIAALYGPALAGFVLKPLLDPTIDGPMWRKAWSPMFPYAPGCLAVYLIEIVTHFSTYLGQLRPRLGEFGAFGLASVIGAIEVGWLTVLAGGTRVGRIIVATLGVLLASIGVWLLTMLVIALGAT